jgi:hypothetical protein
VPAPRPRHHDNRIAVRHGPFPFPSEEVAVAYSAGTAYLEIVPSFRNVESLIANGARNIAKGLDNALGDEVGKATERATKRSTPATEKAGTALGKTFTDAAIRRIRQALAAIPVGDQVLKPLRKELEALAAIDLGRGFDEKDFIARVEKAYAALRKAQQDAQGPKAVSRYTNAGNAAQELGAVQDIVAEARKRGFAAGDAFSDAYQSRLKAMDRILPDNRITAKSSQEERAVAALKARIAEAMKLQVGDVATRDNNPLDLRIGAKISGEDLRREMEQIEALLDQFTERFGQLELVLALDKARQQAAGFYADVQTQAEKAEEEIARAQLRAREQLEREYEKLFDQAELRNRQRADEEIRQAEETARRQAAEAERLGEAQEKAHEQYLAGLDRLEQQNRDLRLRRERQYAEQRARELKRSREADLAAERRHLEEMDRLHEQAIREDTRRQQQAADALRKESQRQFRQTSAGRAGDMLSRARDRIVDLPVQLQANDLDREMAAIRQRLSQLGNFEIGVNIDVEKFADQVQREFTRLKQIAKDGKIDLDVRVDAAAAASELGGILVLLNRLDKKKAEVKVDSDSAAASLKSLASMLALNLGRLGALIAIGSSIGTAIVPAAAAAASTIGAIGTAALAAASGIGVMLLGFSGIGEAVKAMGQLAEDQQKASGTAKRDGTQIAAALDQIRSAERGLAETRRNNAQRQLKAQRDIQDALRDQKDTIEDVARANRDATERVLDAQRNVVRATEDERSARIALNEAYKEAQRALDDLGNSIRGNLLDQRQVTLDLAEAKEELDNLLANPRATEAEREQARITYERRLLQMDEIQKRATELDEEQTKRLEQGLGKSKEVLSAQEALEAATERLKDSQTELARAEEDQVRTRLDGIRQIQQAQREVDDARLAAAEAQRDAAYAEFQAQQSLNAARRQLASATQSGLAASTTQVDNLNVAMSKLSPTAQNFARYIFGLRDAFYALRNATAPMIAGLQDAMESLIGKTSAEAQVKLAPFFDFVARVAVAMGEIFRRIGEMLQGPTFTRFFSYISQTAVPTLELMYDAFENITIGLVNLFLGFTPLTEDVNEGFLGLTESFRKWSEGLETNQGFQKLVDYMRESGPQLWTLITEMAEAFASLVEAAAPVGTVVVQMLTEFFEIINKIPQDVLVSLVAGISAAAAAIALFAGGTAIAMLGIPGLIAAGIATVVIAFSVLVGSSEDLREMLGELWEGIKTGAPIAFEAVKDAIGAMKPIFDNMVRAGLTWYNKGIKPVFDAVVTVLTSFYEALKPSLDNVGGFFRQLGELAFWLYDQAILPAFEGIMTIVEELFQTAQPVFETIGLILGTVAKVVFWLLDKVFMPVIKGIVYLLVRTLGPIFQWLYNYIIKPVMSSIGLAFEIAAALIKVAIGVISLAIKGLAWIFEWLYKNAIKPVWDSLVKNVFAPMGSWIDKNIRPHWDRALKEIGRYWENFKKLIGAPIKFIVETLLNDGLLKGYNWLADKFDVEPKNVKIPAPKGGWTGFREGGAVYGPGTETSDSIRARLSRGEHVLTAAEVRAAGGHQVIYAWRRDLMRRGWDGHAHRHGGAAGRRGTGDGFGDWLRKTSKSLGKKATDAFDSAADFIKDPLKSIKDLAKGLFDKLPGKDTWIIQRLAQIPKNIVEGIERKVAGMFQFSNGQAGSAVGAAAGLAGAVAGNSNSLGGSLGMIQLLRRVFPGLPLNSGFRPGSITLTGNVSYHARNRAVDVPPRSDVFEWIRSNFPASRELIFSPKGNRQIHNGRPHVYSGVVRNTHYDHVHWAYDGGGLLPDTRQMPGGVMQVFHGRRTPDKVLTDGQWQQMATLAAKARDTMSGGNVYNFPYRDSTLNYDELNRWSSRRDALDRVARTNY